MRSPRWWSWPREACRAHRHRYAWLRQFGYAREDLTGLHARFLGRAGRCLPEERWLVERDLARLVDLYALAAAPRSVISDRSVVDAAVPRVLEAFGPAPVDGWTRVFDGLRTVLSTPIHPSLAVDGRSRAVRGHDPVGLYLAHLRAGRTPLGAAELSRWLVPVALAGHFSLSEDGVVAGPSVRFEDWGRLVESVDVDPADLSGWMPVLRDPDRYPRPAGFWSEVSALVLRHGPGTTLLLVRAGIPFAEAFDRDEWDDQALALLAALR